MNSENSTMSVLHRLLLNFWAKRALKRRDKYFALLNLSIYYTWNTIKTLYKDNRFEISAPTQNGKCQLTDGSYSTSDIQEYFKYIIKRRETVTENPPIRIYNSNRKRDYI